jgi:hypothetical protein
MRDGHASLILPYQALARITIISSHK